MKKSQKQKNLEMAAETLASIFVALLDVRQEGTPLIPKKNKDGKRKS